MSFAQPTIEKHRLPPHLLFISACIFLLETVVSSRYLAGFPGPQRYFAWQWTLSYADGFCRRGLLGSALRFAHLDNGNYLLLAAIGWAVSLALFLLLAHALFRLLAVMPEPLRSALFVVALLTPISAGLITQTTADPLQVTLLLYMALGVLLLKRNSNPLLVGLAYLVFGVVSILIHEAAIFFCFASLALLVLRRRVPIHWAALAGYLAGALPALYLTIHLTHHQIPAMATLRLHSVPIPAESSFKVDNFSKLLSEENAQHFHSGLHGYAILVRNAVGALTLPLLLGSILAHALSHACKGALSLRGRNFLAFALPILICAPLYVIAHDWGRFGGYLFMLAIFGLSLEPITATELRPSASSILPPFAVGALLLLAGLTTTSAMAEYVVKGLGSDNATCFAALLVSAVIVKWVFFAAHPSPEQTPVSSAR